MYASSSKRLLQLPRAFRVGTNASIRRSLGVRYARLTVGTCSRVNDLHHHGLTSSLRALPKSPITVFKRGYADLPPHKLVTLPALSPTMETGTIIAWEKEEGDELEEGDILAQIETDKATMDMETPKEGYLAKIVVPAGTKDIPLRELVCIIVSDEGDIDAFKDYHQPPTNKAATPPQPAPSDDKPPPPITSSQPFPPPSAPSPPSVPRATGGTAGRIFASPFAKNIAAEQEVDLTEVQGTGADGRIVSRDVLASKPPPPSVAPPTHPGASYTDIDLTSMRKTIAKRLQESKQNIPHYYLTSDINMSDVLRLRKQINKTHEGELKLSPNDFVIKAASLALRKVPEVNSSWMETFIRQHHNVDISVAVSTEGGLITPIVFGADNKGLRVINEDVANLAKKARNGKLSPNEFIGGTFTISNLGMYGIKQFNAIINSPQSCILAVGASEKRVIPRQSDYEDEDEDCSDHYRCCEVADIMTVTMSCDHRVVDGAVGANWMAAFRSYLENPSTMLL